MRHGPGFAGGKYRIYALYQRDISAKDAVDALKKEYGLGGHSHTFLDGSSGFVSYRPGTGITLQHFHSDEAVTVKWTDVEKRIRQLIAEGTYLTSEELEKYQSDHLESVPENDMVASVPEKTTPEQSPVDTQTAIDTALQRWNGDGSSKQNVARYMEQHGREKDTAAWLQMEYGDDLPAFPIPDAQVDLSWQKVQRRIAQLIKEDRFFTEDERISFDHAEPAEEATVPDIPSESVTRGGDVITIGSGSDSHEADITVTDEEWGQTRDVIPETSPPTNEFLSVAGESFEPAILDVLTAHLLKERDKAYISNWFYSGEGNTKVAHKLSDFYSGRAETVTLESGNTAHYATSTIGLVIEIHGDLQSKHSVTWEEIVPVLRELYLHELSGFRHESIQEMPVLLEGTPAYQVGDYVMLPDMDHEISGRISWIGDTEITIESGPYAWSHTLIGRERFEDLLRRDERNAHLFAPDISEQSIPPEESVISEADSSTYDGDSTEIDVQKTPESQNFRIIDEHLGEGTPKEKFRWNMEAIRTLQTIESEGRQATPEEQKILSRYVGWGGLSEAFDPDKASWADEFLELQSALSPVDYTSARASTLNAHYTSPTVIRAIYEAVENVGFRTGKILEPSCGVGNFFGLLPDAMSASQLYGVELDSITGRIAQQLYPDAHIDITGFEKTQFPDNFFDLAIGNVPFGAYEVSDRRYDQNHFLIHDYFFAKTIDKVHPGGIIAYITSNGISGGTMDKKDNDARQYIARRCDLLGAIRLPFGVFRKNAGTDFGMDILFLQKRDTPRMPNEPLPDWVETYLLEENDYIRENGEHRRNSIFINRYFREHPEMMLGTPEIISGPFGPQLICKPIEGADLAEQLREAVSHIKGQYREISALEQTIEENSVSIPADPDVKNYSFTVVDGDVYYRENTTMVKQDLPPATLERIRGMVELRDYVHRLINLQLEDTDTLSIQQEQEKLNQLYDVFSVKYGLINDRQNRLAFSSDSAYYLLCALEVIDENGRLKRKADMFTKRTIRPHRPVTRVDTAAEALAVSISEKAKVDMTYMMQLTGKTKEELEQDLAGVIFRDIRCAENPDEIPSFTANLNLFPFVTADEYLSGNVRRKLRMAKAMYEVLPPDQQARIQPYIDALEAVQPKDLDASEIEVRLGATWVDKKYIQQFMYEVLDTPYFLKYHTKVEYAPITAEWHITGKNRVLPDDVAAFTTYGTSRISAYEILEDTLNLRDVRIYDLVEDPDGNERRILNGKETTLAAQKQQALRDAFREWIWKDPIRRQRLVQQYNEEMNSTRPREYDGRHISFPGMNPEIQLQPHQVNAIAHILYGGNTLLAHEVGAGKTFEMVAAAMESKRLGLCHKSIIVVPNHLTEQWASEFLRLYPAANILVTTKKDFEKRNRKKFCARIATGDYDAIIIGQSQFEKIPISFERQENLIQQQISEIISAIREVRHSSDGRFTVKQLERTRRTLEKRLQKLRADHKKDDVITFEELGVDRMFVDESDFYKNLFLYTKMRNVAGLSTAEAQKSSDMFAKCRYLDEITGNRGTIFASGTPISNSMTELYTIQRYLQFDRLQEMGMTHFDCWASRFGETVTAMELAPEGTGYRLRTRFAKFFNLPELMNLFKEVADIKTADQLHLPTPEVKYHTIASKSTEIQSEMVMELSERASKVHRGTVNPGIDNMLKIVRC